MKVTIVLVGVFAVLGATLASPQGELQKLNGLAKPFIFESAINDTINKAVALLAEYDPVDVEHQELTILEHHGEIHNLHIEGFSNIVATHIKLSGLVTYALELTTEARKVWGTLEHWKVDGEHFYGDGNARFEINNFKVAIKAKINPIAVEIKDVQITPSIASADVSITGLYNDEKLSQEVSDNLNHFLNDVINNDKELHQQISKFVEELLAKIIGSMLA